MERSTGPAMRWRYQHDISAFSKRTKSKFRVWLQRQYATGSPYVVLQIGVEEQGSESPTVKCGLGAKEVRGG